MAETILPQSKTTLVFSSRATPATENVPPSPGEKWDHSPVELRELFLPVYLNFRTLLYQTSYEKLQHLEQVQVSPTSHSFNLKKKVAFSHNLWQSSKLIHLFDCLITRKTKKIMVSRDIDTQMKEFPQFGVIKESFMDIVMS